MHTILIVDDKPEIVDLLQFDLESLGYTVDNADGYFAALDKFKNNIYDLVILDIAMPNPNVDGDDFLTGIQLYDKITKLKVRPKVIVYTANSRNYDENYLLMGADQFVVKGSGNLNLLSCVEEVLKGNICGKNN